MKIKRIITLIVSIAVCELAGIIGSVFTAPAVPTWYATLVRSPLSPPNWVFAPVWTLLFALMGVSLWLILINAKKNKKMAIGVFAFQLILNTVWSYIFFGRHDLGLAFFELVLLWFAISATIVTFFRISKLAAWLLVPYLIWVTFAGFLNFSLWQLNKEPKLILPPPIETSLPLGYSAINYIVEKTTDSVCARSGECVTPFEYLAMSRCPFTSVCIDNRCTIVCPQHDK